MSIYCTCVHDFMCIACARLHECVHYMCDYTGVYIQARTHVYVCVVGSFLQDLKNMALALANPVSPPKTWSVDLDGAMRRTQTHLGTESGTANSEYTMG